MANRTLTLTKLVKYIFGGITFTLATLSIADMAQAANITIDSRANIYGAGLNSPPSQVSGAGILPPVYNFSAAPRQVLTFSRVTGIINYGVPLSNGPDGADITNFSKNPYIYPSLNGISGLIGQGIGRYLVGIFLDNSAPISSAPPSLNFSGNYNFQELSPLLKQTFFIGDGLTGTGAGQIQKFNVPAGATRLFFGFLDGPGISPTGQIPVGFYNDNRGTISAEFQIQSSAVPEPLTILGSITTLGFGTFFKRQLAKANKKKSDY